MFNVYVPRFVCEKLLAYILSFLNESDIFTFIYCICSILYYIIDYMFVILHIT